MRRRLALRFSPPLDGRCSLAVSIANAEGQRERARSAPAIATGGMPPRSDGWDASPPRRRPLPQGRMDGFVRFSVRRSQDKSHSHARSVRVPMHRPSPVALSYRRYPALACGRFRISANYFTRRHEDVVCAAGPEHHRNVVAGCGEGVESDFAAGSTSSWLRVNPLFLRAFAASRETFFLASAPPHAHIR